MGHVVEFNGSENSSCRLQGFTITNGYATGSDPHDNGGGIYGSGTQATIENCIISENYASGFGGGLDNCDGSISHCMIAGNRVGSGGYGGGLYGCYGAITHCTISWNTAQYGGGLALCDGPITGCTISGNRARYSGGGEGNITSNPLFADSANNDYHLKSEYGRWDPNGLEWLYDNMTSPCIDAGAFFSGTPGDPNDWRGELWPHGGRINMGAYGGTPQASMSPNSVGNVADLDHNNEVDVLDLELLSKDWLYADYLLDTDLNRDGVVDIGDFSILGQQWLWVEP